MLTNRRRLVISLSASYNLKRGGCHGTCSIKPHLAMRSLALRINLLRMSNLASTRIGVFKGFSSLLLSSLFIFKLSFITSL
jgi:hypothetical protein